MPADAQLQQPAQRILEASLRLGTPPGAVSGWAALHLAGARWFEGVDAWGRELPVLLVTARQLSVPPGVRLLRSATAAEQIEMRHGVPCLPVHQALFDEIRCRGQLRPAVAAVDMVLHARLSTIDAFGAWLGRIHHVPGVTLARRALALASPGAESPPETGLRLLWHLDARRGPAHPNVDLYSDAGMFLARVDLFDPVAGVVGEYDGAHHRRTGARAHDIAREDRLRSHGLEYFSVVGGELHDRRRVVERISAAYARAERSALPRRWHARYPRRPGSV